MRTQLTIGLGVAFLAALAADARAQSAASSARSLSLAGSYAARARGYEALFWNPANLGLPDGPSWSVGVLGINGNIANNALSYGQLTGLYGEFLTVQKKSELLAEIRENNPDRMFETSLGLDAEFLSVSLWRFALGATATAAWVFEVTPDAVELLLFGNVGEDGNGKDFTLEGSDALGWVASSVFLSYAHPFTIPSLDYLGVEFSAGVTARYILGHSLGDLRDRASRITTNPLRVNFDAELLRSTDPLSGQGWAIDLGAAAQRGALTGSIAVQNLLRNLSWDVETFELTLLSSQADFDSASSSDTTLTFAELTPDDQQRISDFLKQADFPTRLRLSGLYELENGVRISGDYEEVIGGMLRTGWPRSLSVGVEFRPISVLPLRAGLATSFNQAAYSGGLGIYAQLVHVDFAVARRGLPGGDGLVVALSISIWPGAGY